SVVDCGVICFEFFKDIGLWLNENGPPGIPEEVGTNGIVVSASVGANLNEGEPIAAGKDEVLKGEVKDRDRDEPGEGSLSNFIPVFAGRALNPHLHAVLPSVFPEMNERGALAHASPVFSCSLRCKWRSAGRASNCTFISFC